MSFQDSYHPLACFQFKQTTVQMSTISATDSACVSSQWIWRLSFAAVAAWREDSSFLLVWYLFSSSPKYVTVLKNCLEKKVLTSTFLLNMCDAACMHTLYGSHYDNQMHMSLAPLHFIQLITYSIKRKIACSSAHTIEKCSKWEVSWINIDIEIFKFDCNHVSAF